LCKKSNNISRYFSKWLKIKDKILEKIQKKGEIFRIWRGRGPKTSKYP